MKTILKRKTSQVLLDKYYNLDGTIIDEGDEVIKLPKDSTLEITEIKQKIYDYEFEVWQVKVNGEKFATDYEITGYAVEPDQIVLHACTGCG